VPSSRSDLPSNCPNKPPTTTDPGRTSNAQIWLNFRNDWRAARFLRANELLLTRSFRQQLSHKRGRPLRSAVVIIRASRYTEYTYLVRVSFLIEPFVRKWFYTYVQYGKCFHDHEIVRAKQNDASRDFSFHRTTVNVTNVKQGKYDERMEIDIAVCWLSLWRVRYVLLL